MSDKYSKINVKSFISFLLVNLVLACVFGIYFFVTNSIFFSKKWLTHALEFLLNASTAKKESEYSKFYMILHSPTVKEEVRAVYTQQSLFVQNIIIKGSYLFTFILWYLLCWKGYDFDRASCSTISPPDLPIFPSFILATIACQRRRTSLPSNCEVICSSCSYSYENDPFADSATAFVDVWACKSSNSGGGSSSGSKKSGEANLMWLC